MSSNFITIEDFPDEILEMILDKLSVKEMINSTLVCKRWNDIISNSQKFLSTTYKHIVSHRTDQMLDET
jgi:hypothetical protein